MSLFASISICKVAKDAAGIAGNIFAFGLFVSPIPTFRRIIRNGSTEMFSGLPYIYSLMDCLICMWYGTPLISHDNLLVTTFNSIGAVFQFVYIILFMMCAEKEKKVNFLIQRRRSSSPLATADNCFDKEVIYAFLDANGIGKTHSDFYISYALQLESKLLTRHSNLAYLELPGICEIKSKGRNPATFTKVTVFPQTGAFSRHESFNGLASVLGSSRLASFQQASGLVPHCRSRFLSTEMNSVDSS